MGGYSVSNLPQKLPHRDVGSHEKERTGKGNRGKRRGKLGAGLRCAVVLLPTPESTGTRCEHLDELSTDGIFFDLREQCENRIEPYQSLGTVRSYHEYAKAPCDRASRVFFLLPQRAKANAKAKPTAIRACERANVKADCPARV